MACMFLRPSSLASFSGKQRLMMFKITLAETEAPGEAPSRAEMEKSLRLTKGGASDLVFCMDWECSVGKRFLVFRSRLFVFMGRPSTLRFHFVDRV